MSIWLTSDCHFNHANILKYEPITRPFDTVQEMNEALILSWNSVVSHEDTVYVVGDFFMGRDSEIEPIVRRLNGKIILIRGNHDDKRHVKVYQNCGIEVKDIEYLDYNGTVFILYHYPIAGQEYLDAAHAKGGDAVLCYGHIHSKAPKGYVNNTYHVGVDTNNLTPISLEQIWKEKNESI